MALTLRENQYRGVNAHLHSYLQNEIGGWKTFHSAHIADLAEVLDSIILPGYEVALAKSLQINEYHPDTGEKIQLRPEPDVTIYDVNPSARRPSSSGSDISLAPLEIPVIETMDEEEELFLTSGVIYRIEEEGVRKPVTYIELLSPSNKPPREDYVHYREKRHIALLLGLSLIEIDYLHQTHPITRKIPSYRRREAGATPYYVLVNNPRPSLQEGRTKIHRFGVNDPIPVIDIPLIGDDKLTVDLGVAYQRTFESMAYFRTRADYEQEPMRFETYTPEDQARIQAVMADVQAKHKGN
jgi:hypothetical protein